MASLWGRFFFLCILLKISCFCVRVCVCLFVDMCMGSICMKACMWKSENNFFESVLFLSSYWFLGLNSHHLGIRCLYPLEPSYRPCEFLLTTTLRRELPFLSWYCNVLRTCDSLMWVSTGLKSICSTGDWSYSIVSLIHARQMLYHWLVSPELKEYLKIRMLFRGLERLAQH